MQIPKLLPVLLLCLLTVQTAQAEVFQYFDEEGTLIVTDNPFGTKRRDRPHHLKQQSRNNSVGINFREGVDYEFYEVSGKTVYDAMTATNRVGPFDLREGRHYAGQTRWNFGLSYNLDFSYQFDGDSIRVSVLIHDIGFRSDITVILPALADENQYETHDFRLWESFMQHLVEHEHDHVRIVQEPRFRQEVISGISGIRELMLPNQSDGNAAAAVKGAIEAKISAVAHDAMLRIKQKNDEYDSLTDHGRKPELRNAFFQGL